jgi:hypothetical protein
VLDRQLPFLSFHGSSRTPKGNGPIGTYSTYLSPDPRVSSRRLGTVGTRLERREGQGPNRSWGLLGNSSDELAGQRSGVPPTNHSL